MTARLQLVYGSATLQGNADGRYADEFLSHLCQKGHGALCPSEGAVVAYKDDGGRMAEILQRASELARSGRQAEAEQLVEEAAENGDSDALLALGGWRLFGLYGKRDLAAAHSYLGRAASAGNAEATRILANLIASGTGCEADFPRARALLKSVADDLVTERELDLLDRMPVPESALKLPAKVLSTDPLIFSVAGALRPEECRYLQLMAEPSVRPSFVIDSATGRQMPHPVRTSDGMSFGPADEDLLINNINRRLAVLTKTEATSGEPLHMLRYRPGQQYRPHLDGLPGVANQRLWTVLVYLNDDYEGGETEFPKLGIRYRGGAGDALVFRNVLAGGQPDTRTQHAGLPVKSGVKWLATRWIRMSAYSPWDEGAVMTGG